ncbi:hypothetical protein E8E13_003102 [Curvularia kusanoi]|uniref:Uncharacterized protein n=1 Tax=Curvularia kusanoi TaxID=90978 RepID=A0A9P4W5X9_CURKU|nr:hypothetical protein E8E13_003102 [Curvularia kusanoi]
MAMLAPEPDLSQHPALRHPRPVTRDTAKAQRMLGLIAESEETRLHREKSITTRWLERPLYAHLDVSDVESEKETDDDSPRALEAPKTHTRQDSHVTKEYDVSPEVPQKQWVKPERPSPASLDSVEAVEKLAEPKVSKLEKSFDIKRVETTDWMPPSYNPEEIQSIASYSSSPEWAALSNTLKQNARQQRPMSLQLNNPNLLAKPTLSSVPSFSSFGKGEPDLRLIHPQTWAAPPANPEQPMRSQRTESYDSGRESFESIEKPWLEGRPRPVSFAAYHTRNRSKTKIASSRSSRLNSYPNFSRKMSGENPGILVDEHIGQGASNGTQDTVYARDTFVESPEPISTPIFARKNTFERLGGRMLDDEEKELEKEKAAKAEKASKLKNRWSTIPNILKLAKPTRRRASNANELDRAAVVEDFIRASQNAPKLNNQTPVIAHRYSSYDHPAESEVAPTPSPRPQSQLKPLDLLPTPQHSPLAMTFDKDPGNAADLPPPFAPWAAAADSNAAPPSPPSSISNPFNTSHRRKSSNPLLSPGYGFPSPIMPASPRETFESRPVSLHSHRSSTYSSHMATSLTSPTSTLSTAPSRLSFLSPTTMTPPQPGFASSSASTPRLG